ncbi:MAG: DcaP family trimeric outer membrane transporter [Nevskia sp.]|nr:DcaP family trimeric outer membrane transporter [Nevskia sp.]
MAGVLGCAVATMPQLAQASDFPPVDFGGYVKLDVLYSHFGNGPVAQGFARDFYVPGSTPVTTPGATGHSYLNFSAKETRLWLGTNTDVQGYKVGAYVEADFLSGQNPQTAGSTTPDARITNAYNPALRRAFITVDNWLFGQDWTTFQNVAALPETADFIGVEEGTVFVRQPQIRYTYGGFQASLENPETWAYTPATKGASTANKTDDNVLPDLVLRYNLKTGVGDFSVAGLGRQLKVQSPSAAGAITGADDTAFGYGGSLSGKMPLAFLPGDDVRFMFTAGRGLGRYVALATIADTGIDTSGKFKPVTTYNGFVAYHHQWSAKWRSNLMLSAIEGDAMGGDNIGGNATKRTESAAANLFYSPVKNLSVGGEYRYADRADVAGDRGRLNRLQFSAKYVF